MPLGDLTGAQLRILADLAQAYGDGTVRVTHDQDLLLRWVPVVDVPASVPVPRGRRHSASAAPTRSRTSRAARAPSRAAWPSRSRAASASCSAITSARAPDVVAAVPGLDIKISGCPNGCGQHHIAGIGFQGSVRKVGDRAVPQYFVMLGGGVDGWPRRVRSARREGARAPVPLAVERLVALYTAERAEAETAPAFFRRVELARVKNLLADLEALTPEDAAPADFIDLGEETEFKVETQEGECMA